MKITSPFMIKDYTDEDFWICLCGQGNIWYSKKCCACGAEVPSPKGNK